MTNPKDLFLSYLRRHNLKMTAQRERILLTFLDADGHLTSEELHALVKTCDPSIGQATVYRTLKLLTQSGIAKELQFGEGVARYELAYGREHHDHLICERCGAKIEVVDEEIERLQEKLAESYGFALTGHRMYLVGVCRACRLARGEKGKV